MEGHGQLWLLSLRLLRFRRAKTLFCQRRPKRGAACRGQLLRWGMYWYSCLGDRLAVTRGTATQSCPAMALETSDLT